MPCSRHRRQGQVFHHGTSFDEPSQASESRRQVKAKDTVRFHLALTTIMKAHMDSLKKREKSKRPKTKKTATTV